MGCPACGTVAVGHGRDPVVLVDDPAFGTSVQLCWRKRRWRCLEVTAQAECSSNRTNRSRSYGPS
ncbi:transposase family protein [Dermatophilus congolensis]|uniref:transposase family protein n=1 Tax=Dermatophilus congolensis TaxID=1863 RepID=UPI001AAEF91D|nr:transposase family protein [Dermatophilus congolensis]MBO3151717.1 transposase family protein [Dermatophilus congolensis]MBO3161282.1 transposase family protein [Dermatophilus congolensis]MBO3162999.1 transposase family protein [Dermatophilus congolensis]MBO3176551.1 transposase family protein [Dermatophilus congolensis]